MLSDEVEPSERGLVRWVEALDTVDLDTLGGDRGPVAKALRRLLKKECWLGLGVEVEAELRPGGVLK